MAVCWGDSSALKTSFSKLLHGVSLQMRSRLDEAPKRRPLLPTMVGKLEDLVFTALTLQQRIFAGFCRFCIGARLRTADAVRIQEEPKVIYGTATTSTYVETNLRGGQHKTGHVAKRRRLCPPCLFCL